MGAAQSKSARKRRHSAPKTTTQAQTSTAPPSPPPLLVHSASSPTTTDTIQTVVNLDTLLGHKEASVASFALRSPDLIRSQIAKQTISDLRPQTTLESLYACRLSLASTSSRTSLSSSIFSAAPTIDTTTSSIVSMDSKLSLPVAAPLQTGDRSRIQQGTLVQGTNDEQAELYSNLVSIASVTGSSVAQISVALCNILGHGTPTDVERGYRALEQLAQHQCLEAYYNLAECLYIGKTPSGIPNKSESFIWFARVVDQRASKSLVPEAIAHAQYRMAMMLTEGDGVPSDPSRSLELFRQSATTGNAFAQYWLGLYYHHGYSIDKPDLREASQWYERSATQGYAEAQASLGVLIVENLDFFSSSAKTTKDALQWLTKAANQDHPRALVMLGDIYSEGQYVKADLGFSLLCYERAIASVTDVEAPIYALAHYLVGALYATGGKGVKVDHTKAMDHLTKSSQAGLPSAQGFLAMMYLEGIGTTKDELKARTLLAKAASQGDPRSLTYLTRQSVQDKKKAMLDIASTLALCEKAAKRGSITAQLSLAILLEHLGSIQQAFVWFERVATAKVICKSIFSLDTNVIQQRNTARLSVARYRINGFGDVSRDPEAGFKDLVALAEEQFEDADYWVAACYEEGLSDGNRVIVKPDLQRAYTHYERAAVQGNVLAQFQVALMLANGVTLQDPKDNTKATSMINVNHEKAFYWYQKAAQSGHCTSQYSLGIYYAEGISPVSRDFKVAKKWFISAARQGSAEAMIQLAQYLRREPETRSEAVVWLRTAVEKNNTTAMIELASMHAQNQVDETANNDDETRYQLGLELLKRAADLQNPLAWRELARYYEEGWGVDVNPKEVIACLFKSEQLGNTSSGITLAEFYYKQGMVEKALKKYKSLLSTGVNRLAQLGIARIVIIDGEGTPKDAAEVYQWLHELAKNIHDDSIAEIFELLGLANENGLIKEATVDTAIDYYQKSMDSTRDNDSSNLERVRFRLATLFLQQERHTEAYERFREIEPNLNTMNHGTPESRKQARHVRYCLGFLLMHGNGVPHNVQEATRWLEKAADEGDGAAAYELGMVALSNDDDEEAKRRFEQGVSTSHAASTREYALLLLRHHTEDQWDGQDAYGYLERAAQLGDTDALVELGHLHEQSPSQDGEEERDSLDAALPFYVTAAHKGNVRAMVKAGDTLAALDKYEEAVEWYTKASTTSTKAKVLMASYRLQGLGGLTRDDQQGLKELLSVATTDHDNEDTEALGLAYFLLGQCYQLGIGAEESIEKAIAWYTQASANDHVSSMWHLGVLHENKKEFTTALSWFQRAAENGHADAQYKLGRCHLYGLAGLDPNPIASKRYLRKAARQGHGKATYEYGRALWSLSETIEALDMYEAAAQVHKVPEALRELGHLYHRGSNAVPQDHKRAYLYYCDAAQLGDGMAALMVGTYFAEGFLPDIPVDYERALQSYDNARQLSCRPLADLAIGKLKHTMADHLQGSKATLMRAEAYQWFKEAASFDPSKEADASVFSHIVTAKVMVAIYHINGWGHVDRDPSFGFQSLLDIAEVGGHEAYVEVAKCYDNGIGVEKNPQQALVYWALAAEHDDQDALARLSEYQDQHGPEALNKFKGTLKHRRSRSSTVTTISTSSSSSMYSI